MNCGEKQAECLDFHHIKPKFKQVNDMVSDGYSKIRILEEINKCVVLCANCHREQHHHELELNGYSSNKTNKRRRWMIDLKTIIACFHCAKNGYEIIDFHHLRKKSYAINYMVSRFSRQRVFSEIIKCIPLCVNCHRKTHNQLIDIKINNSQLEDCWTRYAYMFEL